MAADKSPYSVLNVPKSSSEEEIKAAYIELVKRFDPEKHTERFMVIQKAYKTLTDPAKRAAVDVFTINPVKGEFTFSEEEESELSEEDLTAEIEAARQRLEEAGGSDPEARAGYFRALMRRSSGRMGRKMWSEAISDWTTILKIDPSHLRARNNLLFAYITLGFQYSRHALHDEAIELWERALKMNPDNLKTIHNLAIAADQVADADRSRRYWSEVVKRLKAQLDGNPEDEYVRQSIIEVHKKLGTDALGTDGSEGAGEGGGSRAQRAADEYREILKLNPDDFDAQYQISQAYLDEKRWEEAIAELTKLHDKHPKNVEVLNLLGWGFLNSGRHDRAFKTWQKSLQIDNKNTSTRDNIIRARLEVGKRLREQNIHMKAIVHFKELLKFLPKSPEVHYEIGMTYLSKGDKRSALNAFNKVLQLDSKNKNAKKAISELRLRD